MVQAFPPLLARVSVPLAGLALMLLGGLGLLRPLEAALSLVIVLLVWHRWLGPGRPAPSGRSEGDEKFWALFNGTTEAVFLRADDEFMGRASYLEVNDVACQRLGYSRAELLTMHPGEIEVLEEGERVADLRRMLAEQGHAAFESAFRTKDGQTYPVEVRVHRMNLAGKPLILSMARDITQRRRDQADLKQSLTRLQATLESTADGLLVVDAQGRITDYNRQFMTMWGLSQDLLERDDETLAMEHVLGQLKTPDQFQAKIQHLRLEPSASSFDVLELWDGKVFERYSQPQLLDGLPVGRVWSFRDITARKKTEQFVRRLSLAVEQSPVSILITDTAGGIEFVNPRVEETTGYSRQELLGQNPRVFNSGTMPPQLFEGLWSAITAGKVWKGEIQNKKKSGELFWEHATVAPITDSQGVVTQYMSIKEDITIQKQLQNQLRHSQKLEAVGQLAGGVAHDFNNILQVINGYGTLIQMTMAETDGNRTAIGEILKAAERAAHLTHSLLAFSRKQIMNPRSVDLHTVVTNVDKFLRRVIGEDIQLKAIWAEQPLPVWVDIGQIEQVLMNLATNARDAMPGGGILTIRTEAIHTDQEFQRVHGFGKAGHYALLTVTDTGAGMDEATQKRIFDPFFTTKEMGRGTGLGLSIVYGIIKQHGGYITASSEPGQGTDFRIYLPLVDGVQGPEQAPVGLQSQVKGSETVLVAEDEPGVRSMVEMILKKYGYRVILAQDGQEAVDQFRAHQDEVKLVLMDIIMPRKSGRQAYDEIRALAPGIKVLFTSGYTADFIKSRGDLDQGMELVMKPVQPMDLLRKLRELLDRGVPEPVA